ncbi:unnamed protein product [Pseudo-nitzschia multistriata]|uniref:Uncharacterized protein n=1 Tax=Pseudo-nitzschia multistriata TaxID=183589 RepID=A0A448ZPB5_9STRA|nr:unnamed protein product [Pseudo-nitzschia multistriata]
MSAENSRPHRQDWNSLPQRRGETEDIISEEFGSYRWEHRQQRRQDRPSRRENTDSSEEAVPRVLPQQRRRKRGMTRSSCLFSALSVSLFLSFTSPAEESLNYPAHATAPEPSRRQWQTTVASRKPKAKKSTAAMRWWWRQQLLLLFLLVLLLDFRLYFNLGLMRGVVVEAFSADTGKSTTRIKQQLQQPQREPKISVLASFINTNTTGPTRTATTTSIFTTTTASAVVPQKAQTRKPTSNRPKTNRRNNQNHHCLFFSGDEGTFREENKSPVLPAQLRDQRQQEGALDCCYKSFNAAAAAAARTTTPIPQPQRYGNPFHNHHGIHRHLLPYSRGTRNAPKTRLHMAVGAVMVDHASAESAMSFLTSSLPSSCLASASSFLQDLPLRNAVPAVASAATATGPEGNAMEVVLKDYAPAATSLFNNMKLPAAVVTAGMISLGFATSFPELPRETPDNRDVFPPHIRARCSALKRLHIVVALIAVTSELIVVMWAAVAVNQLTEKRYPLSTSVWELLQGDPSCDLAWSAVNSHFVLGIIGFVAMLTLRAYVMLLAAEASGALMTAASTGTGAALCLMISIVNRGVESGGGGTGERYGTTILDLLRHYVVLLAKNATNEASPGPLQLVAIVLELTSLVFMANVLISDNGDGLNASSTFAVSPRANSDADADTDGAGVSSNDDECPVIDVLELELEEPLPPAYVSSSTNGSGSGSNGLVVLLDDTRNSTVAKTTPSPIAENNSDAGAATTNSKTKSQNTRAATREERKKLARCLAMEEEQQEAEEKRKQQEQEEEEEERRRRDSGDFPSVNIV